MTDEVLIGNRRKFEDLVKPYESIAFRKNLCIKYGWEISWTNAKLNTYLAEMRYGYDFISNHIPPGKLRILEVGAGLGLLSIYLKSLGHEVVALEPAALSFDFFEATKQEIWSDIKDEQSRPKLVSKLAEELSVEEDGEFDFIFSINVIEHIANVKKATNNMISVLKHDGICVNLCPNYNMPYEPHYSIPLVPGAPQLSRRIFAYKIDQSPDIWQTLNFITYFDVLKMAKSSNVKVHFEKGIFYDTMKRLINDEVFAQRHGRSLTGRMLSLLMRVNALWFIKWLHPMVTSPMVFTYRHKEPLRKSQHRNATK